MNLPCKENKCLKYPACKNKKLIICTPLREYCDEVTRTRQVQDGEDIWDLLYSTFPNLVGIQLDQVPKGSNITNVKDLLVNRRKIKLQTAENMIWKPQEYEGIKVLIK